MRAWRVASYALLVVAVGLLAPDLPVLGTSAAWATPASDWDGCTGPNIANVARLAPCDAVIHAASRSKHDLAIAYINRATAREEKGDRDGALGDYDQAISLDPTLVFAYLYRGASRYSKGDHAGALADYDQAISLDPKQPVAYQFRGAARDINGDPDGAIADFSQAIALNPKDATSYFSRGVAREEKRDHDGAIADFGEAIALNPKDAGYFVARASSRDGNGDLDGAIADYGEAIGLDPKATTYLARGNVHVEKKNYDRAIADYDKVIALEPQSARAYANRGLAKDRNGDENGALADLGKVIDLVPQSAVAYTYRGDVREHNGEHDAAIADYSQAISLDPKNASAYFARGEARKEKGEYDGAIGDYSKSMSLDPALQTKAWVRQGEAYVKKGDREHARTAFDMAIFFPEKDADGQAIQEFARKQLAALDAKAPAEVAAAPQAVAPAAVDMGRRVALVIGNSAYTAVPALPHPVSDAGTIATTLRQVGFQVVTLDDNLTRNQFLDALGDFARQADTADWAVVYYAGHGIEMNGTNYLIPVDAKLASDRDVEFEAIPLDRVISAVDGARKLHVVILDACRNNPFHTQRTSATRSIGRGLARVEPNTGTLVVYAAKDGETALDGDGASSPFVAALAERLPTQGIEIGKLFRLVRDDVLKATDNQQEPFVYGSLPGEDFFFAGR